MGNTHIADMSAIDCVVTRPIHFILFFKMINGLSIAMAGVICKRITKKNFKKTYYKILILKSKIHWHLHSTECENAGVFQVEAY